MIRLIALLVLLCSASAYAAPGEPKRLDLMKTRFGERMYEVARENKMPMPIIVPVNNPSVFDSLSIRIEPNGWMIEVSRSVVLSNDPIWTNIWSIYFGCYAWWASRVQGELIWEMRTERFRCMYYTLGDESFLLYFKKYMAWEHFPESVDGTAFEHARLWNEIELRSLLETILRE